VAGNPYAVRIDTDQVLPSVCHVSESKLEELAGLLQHSLAESGVELSLDDCRANVRDLRDKLEILMNIRRPACLEDFSQAFFEAVCSAVEGPIPFRAAKLPMHGILEALLHISLATRLGANLTAEAHRRRKLLSQAMER